ncbi:hypothetical protein [Janthinobacterium sp. B9-8]|uniref:hypothetical protein n=1 Tax=Janthinobacterium sp. B9-8 TaxID=1236179 RepID=UPI00061D248B|nr:hypothetical protein [Janthinobacterium sp. B9-8]AMC34650.1 hypothetical protein VN23_08535 [Janthinobacterium sp. B9-8]
MDAQPLAPNSLLADSTVVDSQTSGVAWGAVLAGAVVAAALSFILLILGVGLGLSSISPYSYSASPMGLPTIAWLMFMQLAASGIGGYIAGRLRVKWAGVHRDEVHFRDTAHGLLAWALATLVTVAVLAGGARAVLSSAIEAGVSAPSLAIHTQSMGRSDLGQSIYSSEYFAGVMLRSNAAAPVSDSLRAEVGALLMSGVMSGGISPEDRAYLGQLIAKRSGLGQVDAEHRVDEVYARAAKASAEATAKSKAMAETARKAAAHSALWMFVALLLGAFIASFSATFGGRARDHDRATLRPLL